MAGPVGGKTTSKDDTQTLGIGWQNSSIGVLCLRREGESGKSRAPIPARLGLDAPREQVVLDRVPRPRNFLDN